MYTDRGVPRVYLSFDDLGLGIQFVDALEGAGHEVAWPRTSADVPPEDLDVVPDVVILGPSSNDALLGQWSDGWRALDPPPAVMVLCPDDNAVAVAESLQALPVSPQVDGPELNELIPRALALRFAAQLNLRFARHAAGVEDQGDELGEAAQVLARARTVDAHLVREALRRHIHEYVTATEIVDRLRERGALDGADRALAATLDGTITLGRAIHNAHHEPTAAARLLWALASVGGMRLTAEPPDQSTLGRRAVTRARQHLRDRRHRLRRGKANYYEVLEVRYNPSSAEIESAILRLAIRFAPNSVAHLDLGDLASLVEPLWRQIESARRMLSDVTSRQEYHKWLQSKGTDMARLARERTADPVAAEEDFVACQDALSKGEVFKAVSLFASAARRHPDHADYDAYLAWARYRSALEKDEDTAEAALRERTIIESAQTGRGPRPRALLALGMLCAACADPGSARWYLQEALACDPQFGPARQILARLG